MLNVEILVLTSDECPPCKMLTKRLTEMGVIYRDVSHDSDESRTLRDLYGIAGAPVTIIRSEYDMKMLHGYGKKTLEKIGTVARKHKLFR